MFSTVGEACAAAAKVFVPAGAEIIISVHNDLDTTESLPIILGNSNQKFVVAGARGATTTPKIYIKSNYGEEAINRIPEYFGLNISSVGAIYQDLSIEWDTDKSASPTLVIDGGVGIGSARDTIIQVGNLGNDVQATIVTGSPGGQVDLRIPARPGTVESDYGDNKRQLDIIALYDNPSHVPSGIPNNNGIVLFGNGAGRGLTGHTLYLAIAFRDLNWGGIDEPDLVFKFSHNLTNPGLPICFCGLGVRGGCTVGTRTEPEITWDFCDCRWDYSTWVNSDWYTNQNNMGLSFGTKEVINYNSTDAAALLPSARGNNKIVFSNGATVFGRSDNEDNGTMTDYKGGFTGVWRYFEIELGVTSPGNANYKEYIMLFDEVMLAKMFATGSGRADRSLATYES